jgi:hypothetical protein
VYDAGNGSLKASGLWLGARHHCPFGGYGVGRAADERGAERCRRAPVPANGGGRAFDGWVCEAASGICRDVQSEFIQRTRIPIVYGDSSGVIGNVEFIFTTNLNGPIPTWQPTVINKLGPAIKPYLTVNCHDHTQPIFTTSCGEKSIASDWIPSTLALDVMWGNKLTDSGAYSDQFKGEWEAAGEGGVRWGWVTHNPARTTRPRQSGAQAGNAHTKETTPTNGALSANESAAWSVLVGR